jgi:hypothetical protein
MSGWRFLAIPYSFSGLTILGNDQRRLIHPWEGGGISAARRSVKRLVQCVRRVRVVVSRFAKSSLDGT